MESSLELDYARDGREDGSESDRLLESNSATTAGRPVRNEMFEPEAQETAERQHEEQEAADLLARAEDLEPEYDFESAEGGGASPGQEEQLLGDHQDGAAVVGRQQGLDGSDSRPDRQAVPGVFGQQAVPQALRQTTSGRQTGSGGLLQDEAAGAVNGATGLGKGSGATPSLAGWEEAGFTMQASARPPGDTSSWSIYGGRISEEARMETLETLVQQLLEQNEMEVAVEVSVGNLPKAEDISASVDRLWSCRRRVFDGLPAMGPGDRFLAATRAMQQLHLDDARGDATDDVVMEPLGEIPWPVPASTSIVGLPQFNVAQDPSRVTATQASKVESSVVSGRVDPPAGPPSAVQGDTASTVTVMINGVPRKGVFNAAGEVIIQSESPKYFALGDHVRLEREVEEHASGNPFMAQASTPFRLSAIRCDLKSASEVDEGVALELIDQYELYVGRQEDMQPLGDNLRDGPGSVSLWTTPEWKMLEDKEVDVPNDADPEPVAVEEAGGAIEDAEWFADGGAVEAGAEEECSAREDWIREAKSQKLPKVEIVDFVYVEAIERKTHGEVLTAIGRMHARAKAEGFDVRRLHSDRGREYNNKPLRDWCARHAVHKTLAVAEEHQGNGRAEGAIMRVKNKARVILEESGSEKTDWPLAAKLAAHELKNVARKRLKIETHQSLPFNTKVQVSSRSWKRETWESRTTTALVKCPSADMSRGWVVATDDGKLLTTGKLFPSVDQGKVSFSSTGPAVDLDAPDYRVTGKKTVRQLQTPFFGEPVHGVDKLAKKLYEDKLFRPRDLAALAVQVSQLAQDSSRMVRLQKLLDAEDQSQPEGNSLDGDSIQESSIEDFESIELSGVGWAMKADISSTLNEVAIQHRKVCALLQAAEEECGEQVNATVDSLYWSTLDALEHQGCELQKYESQLLSSAEPVVLRSLSVADSGDSGLDKDSSGIEGLGQGGVDSSDPPPLQTKIIGADQVRREPEKWVPSMTEEYQSLVSRTGAVEELSDSQYRQLLEDPGVTLEIIPGKLVYVHKSSGRRKSRIVGCGNFCQGGSSERNELYASGAGAESLRLMIRRCALQQKWALASVDVRTAFLQAPLLEQQRDGRRLVTVVRVPSILRETGVTACKFWKVRKALYGLASAPKSWSNYRDKVIAELEIPCEGGVLRLSKMLEDANLLHIIRLSRDGKSVNLGEGERVGLVALYVDDILIGAERPVCEAVIKALQEQWELSPPEWIDKMGDQMKFAGYELQKTSEGIRLHQESYVQDLLEQNEETVTGIERTPAVKMSSFDDPVDEAERRELTKRSQCLIGQLLWLAGRTRPDLSYGVSMAAQKIVSSPREALARAEHLVRYLRGSPGISLHYKAADGSCGRWNQLRHQQTSHTLDVYTDASFAADEQCRSFGSVQLYWGGALVSWSAARQTLIAAHTAECELYSLSEGHLMGKAFLPTVAALMNTEIQSMQCHLYCDNMAAVQLCTLEAGSWRTRHLRLRGFTSTLLALLMLVQVSGARAQAPVVNETAGVLIPLNNGTLVPLEEATYDDIRDAYYADLRNAFVQAGETEDMPEVLRENAELRRLREGLGSPRAPTVARPPGYPEVEDGRLVVRLEQPVYQVGLADDVIEGQSSASGGARQLPETGSDATSPVICKCLWLEGKKKTVPDMSVASAGATVDNVVRRRFGSYLPQFKAGLCKS
ncbi:Retrovirus-related Pol polyprotein from transposon TNT 1-94 [Symbiodinium microadriaticum]|uniref:Retrovirus-related Pol polyprotein from transposon TNT 1-94 n=1 Tax=Symbiodinium microadriaticum TaxID=2951 RepID=A0A1Q9D6R7_SYMMI|nr:Retrovirus-related Pol polyprotein from transposon TNT 1-94 [Symbiodinium microadriaticum]